MLAVPWWSGFEPSKPEQRHSFCGMASLREQGGAGSGGLRKGRRGCSWGKAEAGVNSTAPRICSGVPDCPSGARSPWKLWSKSLDMSSGAPGGLSRARLPGAAENSDRGRRSAPGSMSPWTGDAVLCRMARAARGPPSHRSSPPPLPLFPFHPQPGAHGPHPHQADGEGRGAGREEGRRDRRLAPPPFALRLPFLVLPTHQVLLCRPCPPFLILHHDLQY